MELMKESKDIEDEPILTGKVNEEDTDTDVEDTELDLSVSQLDGVGAVTQKKLDAFGVTNLIDICVRGSKEISEITGVSKTTTDSWVFKAQKLLEEND